MYKSIHTEREYLVLSVKAHTDRSGITVLLQDWEVEYIGCDKYRKVEDVYSNV